MASLYSPGVFSRSKTSPNRTPSPDSDATNVLGSTTSPSTDCDATKSVVATNAGVADAATTNKLDEGTVGIKIPNYSGFQLVIKPLSDGLMCDFLMVFETPLKLGL